MGRLARRRAHVRATAAALDSGQSAGWTDTYPDVEGWVDESDKPPSRGSAVVPGFEGSWALTIPALEWGRVGRGVRLGPEHGVTPLFLGGSEEATLTVRGEGKKLHRWSFRVDEEDEALFPTEAFKCHGQPVAWEDRDSLVETSAREEAVLAALMRAILEGVLVYRGDPRGSKVVALGADLPLVQSGRLAHWVAKTFPGGTVFVCGEEAGSERLPLASAATPLCSACKKQGRRESTVSTGLVGFNQWMTVKIPSSIRTIQGDVEHPTLVCPGWGGGEWVEVSEEAGFLVDSGLHLVLPRENGALRRLEWMIELDRLIGFGRVSPHRRPAWQVEGLVRACREARRERPGLRALWREGTFVLALQEREGNEFTLLIWKEGHLAFRETCGSLAAHSPRLEWSTRDPLLAAGLASGALEWEGDDLQLGCGRQGTNFMKGEVDGRRWSAGSLPSSSPTPLWWDPILDSEEGVLLEVVHWTRLHFNPWEEAPQPGKCSLRGEGGEAHRLGVFVVPEGNLSEMWQTNGRDVKVTARVPIREGRVLVSRKGRIVGDWIDSPDEALLADDDNALVVVGWDPRWVTDVEYWEVLPAPPTRRPWEKTTPTLQRTALPKSWF